MGKQYAQPPISMTKYMSERNFCYVMQKCCHVTYVTGMNRIMSECVLFPLFLGHESVFLHCKKSLKIPKG